MFSNQMKRRALLLTTTAVLCGAGFPAMAQEDEEAEAAEAAEEAPVAPETASTSDDVVTVTGSRLRRDEFTSSAPIQVITSESATLEGLIDAGDVLQGASVAAGSVQFNNRFGGFVIEGGAGVRPISLRGLGGQRTLVLLNGKRHGPAGVQGQVGAFDLSVIPESVVQRYEILKDGASSIYGSDAVAGVVNLITRTSIESPELTVDVSYPFKEGGETLTINGAYGFNFDTGNIVLAGEYQRREPITLRDRKFLACQRDLIRDENGNIIDRQDRSITQTEPYAGCENLYHNTVDILFASYTPASSIRYIPSPDGVTVGPLPGYRPRDNGRYDDGPGAVAYYEDVLFYEPANGTYAQADTERVSLYGTSDFELNFLGGLSWRTEGLYTSRTTTNKAWRQFFPVVGTANDAILGPVFGLPDLYAYPDDPTYVNPVGTTARPVMPYPSNGKVKVDYYSFASSLEGDFGFGGFLDDWGWSLEGVYSKSEGEYGRDAIIASETGDVTYEDSPPPVNYFDPGFLGGERIDELVDAIGVYTVGTTEYEQFVITGVVTGDLISLPAGEVAVAVGAEYREFSIDDQPDPLSQAGDLWNSSTALVTKGDDNVKEVFAEAEIPILAGEFWAEELTVNVSGRLFDYDSYGSDEVWKAGVNWQVNPAVRLRATHGTSYRAPALYELFLGDQTSFADQVAIDPCIDWGQSSNENLRANCAADGIPSDYGGGSSGATIISGGGAGVLEAETSEATTLGFIFTPAFTDLSIAVDYFEIQVTDEVARLGSSSILGGCYGAPNFPNAFCDLFDRGAPGEPYSITEIRDSYLNVNNQETKGFDLTIRYEHDFDFGNLLFEGQGTYTTEDVVNLFDPALASGFDTDDFNGTIGDPELVFNARLALERGDFTYNWFVDYVGEADNSPYAATDITYFGYPTAVRDVDVPAVFYHSASVRWEGETLTVIVGVNNIFNQLPPTVSIDSTPYRFGNVPYVGTQYPFEGRSAFVTLNKTF